MSAGIDEPSDDSHVHFVTTHWSVVLSAREQDSPESAEALEQLCRAYWYPLYSFLRRQGRNPHDAEDLVQEFFSRLLQKRYLKVVDPERGRFRTFLIMAMKRFVANEWDRLRAQKRGGAKPPLPLDTALAENRYQDEAMHDLPAEVAFDRQWALTLLDDTLSRLGDEQRQQGKDAEFAVLSRFLTADRESIRYAEAAAALGQSEPGVRMTVHRLRRRFRGLFREAIAQTVSRGEDVDAEIRYLLEILSR